MAQKVTTEALREAGLLPSEFSKNDRSHGYDAYPKLNLKVFIVGSCFLGGVVEMLAKAGCRRANTIADADMLLYTGGEDVDPQLYGEKVLRGTYFSADRDSREMDIFVEALRLGKPQVGICRGMQFLAVMNGSKLYQDVSNHGMTHNIVDLDGNVIRASSMHHQMVIEDSSMFPVAWAEEVGHSGRYAVYGKETLDAKHRDLEAAIFPNINAFAVQGHPEVGGYPDFTIWFLNQVRDFLDDKSFVIGAAEKDGSTLKELPFMKVDIR